MEETAKQYQKRLLSYLGKDDPIRILRSTIRGLERYLGKASSSKLKERLHGKWSVADLLAHFAEGELVYGYRIRMIARANRCTIQGYDQNVWVLDSKYLRKKPKMAFDFFRSLRLGNIAFLNSLNKKQWDHYGIHSERGKESIRLLTSVMAGHDRNHLRQIQRLVSSS
jgi:hypothetical protein